MSLTLPEDRTTALYECGPYLFEHGLRKRIGDQALLGALDEFARSPTRHYATTAQLLAAIQARTPVPLTPFFDSWVYGGWIPSLDGTWTLGADGAITGTMESDVPFGDMEVPVRVNRPKASETTWCLLHDGHGTWSFPAGAKPDRVDLDPDGLVLARGRKLHKG